MPLLDKTQYGIILFATNKFIEIEDIKDHFIAEYRRNVIDNPKFIEKLSQIVQYVKKNVDEVRKEQIQTDKENGYKDFGGVQIGDKEYYKYRFSAKRLGFGLIAFPGGGRISYSKMIDVEKALKLFRDQVKNKKEMGTKSLTQSEKNNLKKKLEWKGTPAQFGFFIIELIGKGYLEKPTGSYKKDAKLYLDFFDIKADDTPTTEGTIAKEISSTTNSISSSNAQKFKLPNIDKLE